MDKIVYNLVYNRKGSLNKKGTALVQIEAYQGKRKSWAQTDKRRRENRKKHTPEKTL